MGMGSPNVFIKEYDLSEIVPSFKGVTGAIVIDSARGKVNEKTLVTSEKQFIETHGAPLPRQFGLTSYSALNFLKTSNSLLTVRVDKGQTYASALVRAEISPLSEYDAFGYVMGTPAVDPIVYPRGPITIDEFNNYQFPQYPTLREVAEFTPAIALLDKPMAGDTTFVVDNVAPISVGQKIAFKDTTGMTRDEAMAYSIYTVVSKATTLTPYDYLKITGAPLASVPYGTAINKVNRYYLATTSVLTGTTNIGSPVLTVGSVDAGITAGTVLSLNADNTQKGTVLSVGAGTITLTANVTVAVASGFTVKKETIEVAPFALAVTAKTVMPSTTDTLWVSNNDPIAEGDEVQILGINYTVSEKYQLHNNVNTITVDSVYVDQTSSVIGDQIYDVNVTDSEFRDAFLVVANTPGEWGNKVAIAIRDSKNYSEAFWVDVYYEGNLVEEWEVTRVPFTDGFGRQMFLEDKINNGSSYIQVKNNEFMTDAAGVMIEPLKTLYYVRQLVEAPIYTQNATTVETVWDGDNRIRISASEIANIDVTKPVMVGNSVYNIASLGSASVGGPQDTIVLESVVSLGLNNLPPLDRNLPVGSPVKQYFTRTKTVDLSVASTGAGAYTVTITGTTLVAYTHTYTFTATGGSTAGDIIAGLNTAINTHTAGRLHATVNGTKLRVSSAYSGVDFVLALSANLSQASVATNARAFTYYATEKISNSILPNVNINSQVDLVGGRFTIRDAGANRQSGGDDIGFPTIGQYITALEAVLREREQADFVVLMDGGVTAPAYHQAMIEVCMHRQDAVALFSIDYDAQANPDINKVILARQDMMINSSYGALYTPWTQVYDKFNDFEIYISPESWAARAISYIAANREIWFAAAGWDNARVTALKVFRRYSQGERDALYDNQINAIRFDPKKGLSIWGQKTLQVKPSSLDRLNVRLLLIVIEKQLREYLDNKVFSFNDSITREAMMIEVGLFLQDIKVRRGLYDYNVVCDESNNTPQVIDNHEMYLDVYLKPTQVAEYITARVVVTRTGANFSEVRI